MKVLSEMHTFVAAVKHMHNKNRTKVFIDMKKRNLFICLLYRYLMRTLLLRVTSDKQIGFENRPVILIQSATYITRRRGNAAETIF